MSAEQLRWRDLSLQLLQVLQWDTLSAWGWGGAATALLGATLAEWQRKRAEEEAARLAALRNSGGGDEGGDGGGRTNAGRKAYQAMMQEKCIVGALQAEQNAKAQAAIAKAAQADMTQEEKLSAYKQTAGYIARQESNAEYERQKAIEAQRAGERNAVSITEEYKAQEQARQNAVGGKPLALPVPQEPNPPDKYNDGVSTWWDVIDWDWWRSDEPWPPPFGPKWNPQAPTVDPAVIAAAMQSGQTQVSATQTAQAIPTASPTITPIPVPTSMWVTYGANFWKDPSLVNNPIPANLVVESGLPATTVVIPTGETRPGVNGFQYVQVKTANGQTGWIVSTLLEGVFNNPLPLVTSNKNVEIPANLINPTGPAQNLKLNLEDILSGKITPGDKEFWNLCGEFVTAYITKRPIDVLLNDWMAATPSDAKKFLSTDSTTNVNDLKNILDLYDCQYYPLHNEPGNTWNTYHDEPFRIDLGGGNKIINVTPGKIQSQLDLGNQLILGVAIDANGVITSSGNTPHWIVVEKVQAQGINDGQVLSYSSSSNTQDINDYQTIIDAALKFIKIDLAGNPNIDIDKVTINDNGPMGLFVNPNSCTSYVPPASIP